MRGGISDRQGRRFLRPEGGLCQLRCVALGVHRIELMLAAAPVDFGRYLRCGDDDFCRAVSANLHGRDDRLIGLGILLDIPFESSVPSDHLEQNRPLGRHRLRHRPALLPDRGDGLRRQR